MGYINRLGFVTTFFVVVLFVGMAIFSSCRSDEGLEPYVNSNLTDTSGKYIPLDLFISGELDGVPFAIYNGVEGYGNWAETREDTCGMTIDRFKQIHTTVFSREETNNKSFSIDFNGCLSSDSLLDSWRIDSVLVVGNYVYAPDTRDNRSVVVKYVDEEGVLWTSALGDTTGSFVSFELSALIDNGYDVLSKKIVFGRFEGYLYDSTGMKLRLRLGQFKGRLVVD